MLGLAQQSNLGAVVFNPLHLCMRAVLLLLLSAQPPLRAHSALQRWGDRCQCQGQAQPTSCVTVLTSQLSSSVPRREHFFISHNSKFYKQESKCYADSVNKSISATLTPTPLAQLSMTRLVQSRNHLNWTEGRIFRFRRKCSHVLSAHNVLP